MDSPTTARRSAGFTLVEMLITLAIIALLMGLLLTGLRSARNTAREGRQLNNLRQTYTAWGMYSTNNNESLLPGFIDTGVQNYWKVKYRNSSGQTIAPELCQTYTWRIAGYLDYGTELFLGYLDQPGMDFSTSIYQAGTRPYSMPPGLAPAETLAGSAAALQPEFGLNAYYLGGWWEMNAGVPAMRFIDAKHPTTNASIIPVARSVAQVTRPENILVFCSSTYSDPGTIKGPDEAASGSAWVVPPWLGVNQIWEVGGGGLDEGSINVLSAQAVPLRRFNSIPWSAADGSARTATFAELRDMKAWTNRQDLTGTQGYGSVHTEN
ncbi:MAG: prepilin-type N-terminal cleavage/methylation domain-containing protein [Phycisphaerae bacterium]|nr:prepilin-type N-terminal cleavage/methylation domain-containing protein [Phycisphaerae bacterium]